MKLSELNVGTEYAVVPHWTYSNRDSRNPDSVQENDVVKAILLSKEKYVYDLAILRLELAMLQSRFQ